MLVAKYWAEARLQHKFSARKQKNSQITVCRLGWSNESQLAAEALARQRAREAMQQAIEDPDAFDLAARRESALEGCNGADGLPIREELIEDKNDFAITRNSYGALCLNTPDVMFVDIDDDYDILDSVGPGILKGLWIALIVLLLALFVYFTIDNYLNPGVNNCNQTREASLVHAALQSLGTLIFVFLFLLLTLNTLHKLGNFIYGKIRPPFKRVDLFAEQHPDWVFNLYRTAAGYRLLMLHRKFDPADGQSWKALSQLGVDPLYMRMCQLQKCFRARLTPKPWRMDIQQHIPAGRNAWHASHSQKLARIQWIDGYEKLSRCHASCRFIRRYGMESNFARMDPAIRQLLQLHDHMSQAHSTLRLA